MADKRCIKNFCFYVSDKYRECNPDTCHLLKEDDKCPDCGESIFSHDWYCPKASHCQYKGEYKYKGEYS